MQLKLLSPGKLQVYQTFFDILRGPLLACFNHSYKNGRLSDTQQEVLISFLLKQDTSGKYKDPVCHDFHRSWLPLPVRAVLSGRRCHRPTIRHRSLFRFLFVLSY
jgi:hypothetical protein